MAWRRLGPRSWPWRLVGAAVALGGAVLVYKALPGWLLLLTLGLLLLWGGLLLAMGPE